MVPHLWHSSLRDGLAVSMLVWFQKGETPDAIVWQARNEVHDALCVVDEPHMAYLRAEYREGDPLKLSRKIVLAALGQLMAVAQTITLTMDRLAVERAQVTDASPRIPHLADLFAQIDSPLQEEEARRLSVAHHLTIAWPEAEGGQAVADLPTISINRITGDDIAPSGCNPRMPPPPPPEGWIR